MLLRFYARPDNVVYPPGPKLKGRINHYVGRTFDPQSRAHKANDKPAEFDSQTPAGELMRQRVRREHSLWAADEATAAACGVPFVPVAQDEESGEWLPAPAATTDAKPAAKSAEKKAS